MRPRSFNSYFSVIFRCYVCISFFLFATGHVFAQSTAEPAYANMQRAVGGIIDQVGQAHGYSTIDPRIYGTLHGVGQTATSAVAGLGAGLLVGGVPAWGSLLAFTAISAGVGYAVSLGIDALVKWAFPTTTSGSLTVTAPISTGSSTYPNQILYSGDASTFTVASSDYSIFYSRVPGGKDCWSNDFMAALSCSMPSGPNSNSSGLATMSTPDCNCGSTGCMWGKARLNDYGLRSVSVLRPPASSGAAYSDVGLTCSVGTYVRGTVFGDGSVIPDYVKNCPIGSAASRTWSSTGAVIWSECIVYSSVTSSSSGTDTSVKSLTDAAASLTSSQKSTPVGYGAMALMINGLWQKAATSSGYQGMPYVATQPVTATDVQNWAQANPLAYPTVQALTQPVANVATDLAPSVSTQPTTPVTPATSTTAPTATNPSTQSQTNLGPDPNVGPPTLEPTPTANQILAPILGLFPTFKNFSVPAHAGECPKPSFDALNTHFVLDGHCALFEQQRAVIYGAMVLAFMLISLFIVLSA